MKNWLNWSQRFSTLSLLWNEWWCLKNAFHWKKQREKTSHKKFWKHFWNVLGAGGGLKMWRERHQFSLISCTWLFCFVHRFEFRKEEKKKVFWMSSLQYNKSSLRAENYRFKSFLSSTWTKNGTFWNSWQMRHLLLHFPFSGGVAKLAMASC